MAKFLRPYGKKRGERRTGSRALGGYGEVVFFLCICAMGTIGLYLMLAKWLAPEWQANREFVSGRGEVLDRRVQTDEAEGETRYYPEILVRYEAAGGMHETWGYTITPQFHGDHDEAAAILEQFPVGQEIPCWFDPEHPDRVVFKQGFRWWLWLLVVLPASFVILGGAGAVLALVQSGASAERRVLFSQRAANLELFETNGAHKDPFPTVPKRTDITESPGTHLAYRLPVDVSSRWRSAGMVLLCVFWNAIVVVALTWLIRDFAAGRGNWLAALVVLPLAIGGVGLLVNLVRRIWRDSKLGAVRLEISDHPLAPGGTYDIVLSHAGRLPLRSLALQLVCVEEATYRQGTDTRTAIERVYEQTLYRRRNIQVQPGESFEDRCQLHVPPDTMHSFKSAHNQVRWDLVVRGHVAGLAEIQRRFSIVVYPTRSDPA